MNFDRETDLYSQIRQLQERRHCDPNQRQQWAKQALQRFRRALEQIAHMEGQEGMTDHLFVKKTLALAHATLGSPIAPASPDDS